jgi:hypothetical protein
VQISNQLIAVGIVVIMAISGLSSFILSGRVLALMRERHRDVWKNLGSPTMFLNNSIGNGVRLWLFNVRGGYKRLNDPQLTRLARWMNATSIVYGLSLILITALMVIGIIERQAVR